MADNCKEQKRQDGASGRIWKLVDQRAFGKAKHDCGQGDLLEIPRHLEWTIVQVNCLAMTKGVLKLHQRVRVSIQQNIWANKNTESHFSPVQSSYPWMVASTPHPTMDLQVSKGHLKINGLSCDQASEAESG